MTKLLPTCLFILMAVAASAQDGRLKFLSLSTGFEWIGGKRQYIDGIRPETYNTSTGKLEQDIRSLTMRYNFTARAEVVSKNKKFSLSTGLRYSLVDANVHRPHGFLSDLDFFYFVRSDVEYALYLVKVTQIQRRTSYVGLPLALSWFAWQNDMIGVYIKGNVNFDYRVGSTTKFYFKDANMNQYQDALASRLDPSPQWMSSVGSGVGMQVKFQKSRLFAEATRSFFLNHHTTGITGAQYAVGLNLGILFQL